MLPQAFGIVVRRLLLVQGVEVDLGVNVLVGWKCMRKASLMPAGVSLDITIELAYPKRTIEGQCWPVFSLSLPFIAMADHRNRHGAEDIEEWSS
jgi:hypothetical protein